MPIGTVVMIASASDMAWVVTAESVQAPGGWPGDPSPAIIHIFESCKVFPSSLDISAVRSMAEIDTVSILK